MKSAFRTGGAALLCTMVLNLFAAGQVRATHLQALGQEANQSYFSMQLLGNFGGGGYGLGVVLLYVAINMYKEKYQEIERYNLVGMEDPLYGTVNPLGSNPNNAVLLLGLGYGSELVAAGWGDNDAGYVHAIRWTLSGGTQDLGSLAGASAVSVAYGVSTDGSTIVGGSSVTGFNHQHAFRWTQAGGMQDLGTITGAQEDTVAYAANQDGSVIVGQADNGDAFRWTQAGGMQDLGNLGIPSSVGLAVSADGSVVVGTAEVTGGAQHLFRWTQATGMQDLGTLPGMTNATATGISADGTIVVGYASTASLSGNPYTAEGWYLGSSGTPHAFRWTQATGMQDLNTLMANGGINMTGTTLEAAVSIAPNGVNIGGVGTFPSTSAGNYSSYLASYCDAADALACAKLENPTNTHDFNFDGASDIAWRDSSGNTAIWLMHGAQIAGSGALGSVPTAWSVIGQRDFDGDGNADLLWRDSTGNLAMWLMNGAAVSSSAGLGNVPVNWVVAGTADLNGDGKGDLLWRDGAGDTAIWFMNGGTVSSTASIGNVPTNWTIVGDDNKGDVFWHDSAGNYVVWRINGSQVVQTASLGNVPLATWSIAGFGDFNGDGNTDILWRDTAGDTAIWFLNSSLAVQSTASLGTIPATWSVAQTGDYNSDGYSDIIWIDTSGNVAVWFMNGGTVTSTAGLGNVGTSWTPQSLNAE